MYDFHAHILPTIDHGSYSAEDTAAQLDILARNGVTHAVAAPHFYPDEWNSVKSFLEFRHEGEELIRPLLAERGIAVYPGAEVLASEGLERMENLSDLCIAGTDVLLLELPFFEWSDRLVKTVSRLCLSGLCILLAHIDRYPTENVRRLFDMGAIGQVNCDAFARLLHRRTYRSFVRQGFVRALGSDIHLPSDFREKDIGRACAYLGEELMADMNAWGEQTLLSGEKIET